MWKKEKMLVTSIFSFYLNVFKSFLFQDRSKSGLCGEELNFVILCNRLRCRDLSCKQNIAYGRLPISEKSDKKQNRCKTFNFLFSEPCIANGIVYQSGESFFQECNGCTCSNGLARCTKIACRKLTRFPTLTNKFCNKETN